MVVQRWYPKKISYLVIKIAPTNQIHPLGDFIVFNNTLNGNSHYFSIMGSILVHSSAYTHQLPLDIHEDQGFPCFLPSHRWFPIPTHKRTTSILF